MTVNGRPGVVQKNSGTFTAYGMPLSVGENTITMTAVDRAAISSAGYQNHTETVNVTNRWNNYFYFYLDPLPPSPPSGFTATPGKGFVDLAWNASSESNLAHYQIYRSTTPGVGYLLIASPSSNEPSYADGDVVAGTTYYYVIKAVNTSAQPSGYSTEVSAAPEALPVPTGLTATPGKELVSLVWEAIAGSHIGSYNIYRAEDGGNYTLIGSTTGQTPVFTDTNVDAGVTYTYIVTAVNDWSREGGRSNEASAVPEAISVGVTITAPYNGTYSPTSTVLVKGTVESGNSPEVGVVLVVESRSMEGLLSSSYLAEVNNGSFAAQISLFPGMQNTIRAIATIPEGEQAAAAITLYPDGMDEPVKITALPSSGVISPQTGSFEVTLEAEVNAAGTIVNYAWDFDGDGRVDQVTMTPATSFGYSRPDIFYPTLTVTVDTGNSEGVLPPKGEYPAGMTYTATTVVNVMSMEVMDALLKAKWGDMRKNLSEGAIEKALEVISADSQEKYRIAFAKLKSELQKLAIDMRDIELIEILDNIAKCRVTRDQEFNGQTVTVSYYVYFMKNANGLWKIDQF